MSPEPQLLELLAPAGDWECLRAAWENGADAVYFGCDCGFNARARATNFPVADLPRIADELHRRGVKGYVTLNTLVFSNELAEAEQLVRQIARAGIDAVLVQDIGLARLIRELTPDLSIHASTQMTLTSAECIAAVESLGIERVVLPRELSIDEIRSVAQQTAIPLEAFVHGALCVAYSGQCLTSESLGGRSANRGQCAQACRLPYELICDGQPVELGDQRYLLSPQDLAAFDLIPQLIDSGVTTFKIEGRLKTPEYVANIVRHYRRAIDAAVAHQPATIDRNDVYEMEMSFSRGFSPGWLEGCEHKRLVPAISSAKRGVLLGRVTDVTRHGVEVELSAPVARGDGVVFAGDRFGGQEIGGRVYQVFERGQDMVETVETGRVELRFDRHAVDLQRLSPGQEIWKTDDPHLNARLRASFNGEPQRKSAIDLTVTAHVGQPLTVAVESAAGQRFVVQSAQPLQAARKHPLDIELLRHQLGRLGHTIYFLRELTAEISGEPMLPLSVLGTLRRQMIEQLVAPLPAPQRQIREHSVIDQLRRPPAAIDDAQRSPAIVPLVRSLEQLDACWDAQIAVAYIDCADIRQYRAAVESARAQKREIWLATPRIQKPGEMGIFRSLLRHGADGILVRNLAGWQFFAQHDIPVVTDFSFNVANELTAGWLWDRGVQRVTASYDLNREQLLELIGAAAGQRWEIVIHQHMPMFHMEHCVFCSVLSPGTDKTNCGRPCDRHQVRLQDRIGVEHPLTADVGCRNTLFNATAQSAAEAVPELLASGVDYFRVEFLTESPQQIRETLALYRQLLQGTISGNAVWTQLRALNRVGLTRGTMETRRDPLAII